MKKIINGKIYNTQTARFLDARIVRSQDSWDDVSETLYVTKNNRFFLHGYGGSQTRWALKCGWNTREKRGTYYHDIQAITKKEAMDWVEKFSDNEAHLYMAEKYFSEDLEEA